MVRASRGVSLLEVAVATVIIGVAITALMEFFASATKANAAISTTPAALSIAKAGHEWARLKSFTELCQYMETVSGEAVVYVPYVPEGLVGAKGEIGSMGHGDWSQRFTLRPVNPVNLTVADTSGTTPAMEMTVTALHGGEPVAQLTKLYYPN